MPGTPQKAQPLLGLIDQLCGVLWPCEVLIDLDTDVFKAAHHLHFKLPDEL